MHNLSDDLKTKEGGNMLPTGHRQSLSDEVYDQLFKSIIEGQWKEGEKLASEKELCEIYAVSRATIREVLHRLKMLGVIETFHGKGTYVKKIDVSAQFNLMIPWLVFNEDDGRSVFMFMKAIQVESVRIVSQTITPEQIEVLAQYFDSMQEHRVDDFEVFFQYDFAYHQYIVALTENQLFIRAMHILEEIFHTYLRDIVAYYGTQKSIHHHGACLEALAAHDTEKSVQYMLEHFDMLLDRLCKWIAAEQHNKKNTEAV